MKYSDSAKTLYSSNDFSDPLAMSHYSYIQPFGQIEIPNGQVKRLRHKDSYKDIYNEKKYIVNYGIALSQSAKFSHSADSLKKKSTVSYCSIDNTKSSSGLNRANKDVNEVNLSKSITLKRSPSSIMNKLPEQSMTKAKGTFPQTKIPLFDKSSENPLSCHISSIGIKSKSKSKSKSKRNSPSLNESVRSTQEKNKEKHQKSKCEEMSSSNLSQRKITNFNLISNSTIKASYKNKTKDKGNEILYQQYTYINNNKLKDSNNNKNIHKEYKDKDNKLINKTKLQMNNDINKVKIEKIPNIKMSDVYQEEKKQRLEYEANKRKIDEDALRNNIIHQEKNKLKKSFQSRSNSSTSNRNISNSKEINQSQSKSKTKSKSPNNNVLKSNKKPSQKIQNRTNVSKQQKGKSNIRMSNQTNLKPINKSSHSSVNNITNQLNIQNKGLKNIQISDNNCDDQIEKGAEQFSSINQPLSFRKNLNDYYKNTNKKNSNEYNTGLSSKIMESTNLNTKDQYNTIKKNYEEEIRLSQSPELKEKPISPNKGLNNLIGNNNNYNEVNNNEDKMLSNISEIINKNNNTPIGKANVDPNKLLHSKTSFHMSDCEDGNANNEYNQKLHSPDYCNQHYQNENEIKQINDIKNELFKKKILDWFEHVPNDNHNDTFTNKQNNSQGKADEFALKAHQIKDKLNQYIDNKSEINSSAKKEPNIESRIDQLSTFKNKKHRLFRESINYNEEENDSFYNLKPENEENKNTNYLLLIPNHYTEKALKNKNQKTHILNASTKAIYTKPIFNKLDSFSNTYPLSQRVSISTAKESDSIMPSNPFDSVVKVREFFFFE